MVSSGCFCWSAEKGEKDARLVESMEELGMVELFPKEIISKNFLDNFKKELRNF